MLSNSIAFARNYTSVIDEVYQGASVSGVLNSGRRMVRAGHNAKEILIPKISVTGLGNYTRNVGYKTGAITYEFETKTFNYDRGIRLFADVMDVEEAGVNDRFVEAGAELQRTQVAPEADAFTFAQIAGYTGVTIESESYAGADAEVDSNKTYYTRSGSGTSASPYVYTEVASPVKANLGTYYEMTTTPGLDINFMVVERSAVIRFDKHVASRVFSPNELEAPYRPQ